MAEFPALPLFTDAYLGDTTHLTTIEHGAYLLLLITEWRSKNGELPDNDKLLSRYTKMTPAQWKKTRPVLEPFFIIKNGLWIQARLRDELNLVRQHSRRQQKNVRARWLKNKETIDTKVIPEGQSGNIPLPHPSQDYNSNLLLPDLEDVEGGGVFNDENLEEKFRIETHLTDQERASAKRLAGDLDINPIFAAYDRWIAEGRRPAPAHPAQAFLAWIPIYLKKPNGKKFPIEDTENQIQINRVLPPEQPWHTAAKEKFGEAIFISWIRPLTLRDDGVVVCPSKFFRGWIEGNYINDLKKIIGENFKGLAV